MLMALLTLNLDPRLLQIERPEKELGSESKAASLLLWFTCETFPRDAWVSVFGL